MAREALGFDDPSAFDDLEPSYGGSSHCKGVASANDSAGEWGLYRALKSTIHHAKGFCSFHLYLVNVDTGLEAELFFNNVLRSKSGLYSVKRHSHFAKLYQSCFGEVNPRKLSKAHQLLKHFHKKECLLSCNIIPAKRKSGEFYYKVIEQKNGNSLETNGKLIGNQVETNWKPQQPASVDDKGLRGTNQVIVNKPIINRVIKQSIAPSLSLIDKDKYESEKKDTQPFKGKRAGETQDEYFERVIDETF